MTDFVSSCVKQSSHLDFGYAPQLVEIKVVSLAEITRVVVHGIYDRTCAFEQLGGREALFVETLVITAARGCEPDSQFGTVDRGDVSDELCGFRCSDGGWKTKLRRFAWSMVSQHVSLDHESDVGIVVPKIAGVCTRAVEALLFAGKCNELDIGLECDVLLGNGVGDGEESGDAGPIVVATWCSGASKRAATIVMTGDDNSP